MKIYIKPYLRKLPIIDMLYQSIVEYSRVYGAELSENEDVFTDFKYQKKTDSVTKFLDYMLPTPEDMYNELKQYWEEGKHEESSFSEFLDGGLLKEFSEVQGILNDIRDGNLRYLVRLFYSIKGCWQVLEYMKRFNLFGPGNENGVSIEYDVRSLSIEIDNLDSRYDSETFFTLAKEFCAALLYYNKISIKVKKVNIKFEGKLKVDIHHGAHFFDLYSCKI